MFELTWSQRKSWLHALFQQNDIKKGDTRTKATICNTVVTSSSPPPPPPPAYDSTPVTYKHQVFHVSDNRFPSSSLHFTTHERCHSHTEITCTHTHKEICKAHNRDFKQSSSSTTSKQGKGGRKSNYLYAMETHVWFWQKIDFCVFTACTTRDKQGQAYFFQY